MRKTSCVNRTKNVPRPCHAKKKKKEMCWSLFLRHEPTYIVSLAQVVFTWFSWTIKTWCVICRSLRTTRKPSCLPPETALSRYCTSNSFYSSNFLENRSCVVQLIPFSNCSNWWKLKCHPGVGFGRRRQSDKDNDVTFQVAICVQVVTKQPTDRKCWRQTICKYSHTHQTIRNLVSS